MGAQHNDDNLSWLAAYASYGAAMYDDDDSKGLSNMNSDPAKTPQATTFNVAQSYETLFISAGWRIDVWVGAKVVESSQTRNDRYTGAELDKAARAYITSHVGDLIHAGVDVVEEAMRYGIMKPDAEALVKP